MSRPGDRAAEYASGEELDRQALAALRRETADSVSGFLRYLPTDSDGNIPVWAAHLEHWMNAVATRLERVEQRLEDR
jgi:hypothetical protein